MTTPNDNNNTNSNETEKLTAKAIIDAYLKRLDKALEGIPEPLAADIYKEIQAHIDDSIRAGGDDPQFVRAVLEDLGEPDEYVKGYTETGRFTAKSNRTFKPKGTGTILGVPYDITKPTVSKLANRLWNPTDPRIFVPRVFGVGWDINFGAVAVKLGLLRPDDESESPFSHVPKRPLIVSILIIVLFNIASIIIAALLYHRLPANVPTHYGFGGQPDRFRSPLAASVVLIGPQVVLTVVLLYAAFVKQASRFSQVVSVAVLFFVSIIGTGLYIDSAYYALNGKIAFYPALPVIVGLAAMFAILVFFSRLGLRTEWQELNVIKTRKTT